MDTITSSFTLLLILFASLLVLVSFNIYVARQKPNKLRYRVVPILCFYILGSCIGILGQPLWSILTMCITTILGCIFLRDVPASVRAEEAETMQTLNPSEPIQAKDLFSNSLIIKLEQKYGQHKALAIYLSSSILLIVTLGCFLWLLIDWLIPSQYYTPTWLVVAMPMGMAVIQLVRNYRDAKKL
ncbi:MAG: hypothetical protein LBH79_05180 [Nitrososphaerota archaeon]|nr:hypothetical protein [Nitrososphaerota archaeon]